MVKAEAISERTTELEESFPGIDPLESAEDNNIGGNLPLVPTKSVSSSLSSPIPLV